MSARLAGGDVRAASAAQNRAIVLGLLLTLPCVAAFLIMPDTIMRALFARGAFGVQAADTSAMALVAYGIGLPAFILLRCVTPSFYARGDTATPVRATILSVIANIAIKILLVWYLDYGVMGLALGTSIGAWINLTVLTFFARKRGVLAVTPELKRAIIPVAVIVGLVAAAIFGGLEFGTLLLAGGAVFVDEGAFLFAFAGAVAAFASGVYVFRRSLPLRDAIRAH